MQETFLVPQREDLKHCLRGKDGTMYNFKNLFVFDPSTISEYVSGTRIPDSTTIARAGEAGTLDFLKWCFNAGYEREFDSTAFGYTIKAGQKEVAEWMLKEGVIQTWDPSHPTQKIMDEARQLGIETELLKRIPCNSPF